MVRRMHFVLITSAALAFMLTWAAAAGAPNPMPSGVVVPARGMLSSSPATSSTRDAAASGAISYFDDFSSYPPGSPPSGWLLRGTSQITPTIEEVGGTGPAYRLASFPEVPWQYWDKWLLKDGLVLSSWYTVTVKLNFQTAVADRAGLTIAWNDINWSHVDIQPNIYGNDIEFRVGYSGPVTPNIIVTNTGYLPISPSTDYWLRAVAADYGPGQGQVVVYWSTDDISFRPVVTATGLPDLTGLAGMSTAGPHMPHTYFDDFTVNARGLPGVLPAYSISGQILDAGSTPIAGVTVYAGPGLSATTDASGKYQLQPAPGLGAGTYSLTAYKPGYSFTPQRSVTLPPSAPGQDFVGTAGVTDTVPPTGTIQNPAPSQTFTSAGITVTALAQDDAGGSGVAHVDAYVRYDGRWHFVGQAAAPPYQVFWQPPAATTTQMMAFAINVFDNAGNVNANAGGLVPAPYVKTTQENWVANRAYLNQLALGVHGGEMCSMSSIAMVRAAAGLIGTDFANLNDEANRVWATGMRGPGPTQVASYLNQNGMQAAVIWDQNKNTHWDKLKAEIDAGWPLILNSAMSGGSLTSSGHYIVVVGYADAADANQRQIIAYDPFGRWKGTIDSYDRNFPTPDPPAGVKGRWQYYDFSKLGTIYSVTAHRTSTTTRGTASASAPDEVYVLDTEDIVTYTGDGESPYPLSIFLPSLMR